METTLDIVQFCSNAWAWDLYLFSRHLGIDPETTHTQELFRTFQMLASLLRTIDAPTLEKMSAAPKVAGGAIKGKVCEV